MSLKLYTRFDHPDFTVPRFDYSPEQERDDHGRFAGGGVGLEAKGQGSNEGVGREGGAPASKYAQPLGGHASLIDERESYVAKARAEYLDKRIDDYKVFVETSHELLAKYERTPGKEGMARFERKEVSRFERELAEAVANRADLTKPVKDEETDRQIRDQATHDVFMHRGLGALHEQIGRGWISSSSSDGAMILHADLMSRGVPGGFANDKERATVGNVISKMNADPKFAEDLRTYREIQTRLVNEGLDRDFPGQKEFTVYRGIYGDNATQALKANGEAIHVDSRPATSWSLNTRTAVAFANGLGSQGDYRSQDGAVLSMKIPRSAVIDYYGLHKNSAAEDEFVVAGAHAMPVTVSRPDDVRTDAKSTGKMISISGFDQEDWLRSMRAAQHLDYSPEQERDPHGRFAGGGVGLEGKSVVGRPDGSGPMHHKGEGAGRTFAGGDSMSIGAMSKRIAELKADLKPKAGVPMPVRGTPEHEAGKAKLHELMDLEERLADSKKNARGPRGAASREAPSTPAPSVSDDLKKWEGKTEIWRERQHSVETKAFKDLTLHALPSGKDTDEILAITKDNRVVGSLFYGKNNPTDSTMEGAVEVDPRFRRMGIATAMYAWGEQRSGLVFAPAEKHTAAAEAFWQQKGRPFGGSERTDYSPEQERDPHGRFAGGGVGLEGKSASVVGRPDGSGPVHRKGEHGGGTIREPSSTPDPGFGAKTGEPGHWNAKESGPSYHITYAKSLQSIAKDGLDPNRGIGIGGNAGLAEHSEGKTFLTVKDGVGFWRSRLEAHADDRTDDTKGAKMVPVTLRINKSLDVQHDAIGTRDAMARAMMTKERIEPKHIEFFYDKAWHPITDLQSPAKGEKFTPEREKLYLSMLRLHDVFTTEKGEGGERDLHWLKPDHENPLTAHFDALDVFDVFDAFEAVSDVHTRFDYSPGQERDPHGRFAGGGVGLEKSAEGTAPKVATPKDATREKTYWEKEDEKQAKHLATLASLTALSTPTIVSKEPTVLGSREDLGKLRDELHVMHEGQIGTPPGVHDDRNFYTSEHEAFSTPERAAALDHFKNIVETTTGITQKYPVSELRIAEINGARGTFAAAHNERDGHNNLEAQPGRITITPEQHMKAMGALGVLASTHGIVPGQDQISGLHTYVHEMCHTTSPMQLETVVEHVSGGQEIRVRPSGYQGHGAIIEEVTTEVMARGVMAKLLAETPTRGPIASAHSQIVAPRAAAPSSYQPAIDWTLSKIRTAVGDAAPSGSGLTQKSVFAGPILRDAVQAYRSEQPTRPFSADQAAAHFADAIGKAAVATHKDVDLHAGEISESVRLQFRQVASGEDADILRRFDAETMTRFDAPAASVWSIERNDLAAALAFKNPSPDEMSVLLQLQDNPETLLTALQARNGTKGPHE